ncbi:WXG100 family type VII secretion target [Nocardia paucivorans]|uniref:WXG100 family type VII secretion target n=1 Tax=Nocardia paucivorans TaxID=114259 RepID=UPI000315EFD0|nr:hypothetical protein [Nocardia paucivorans]
MALGADGIHVNYQGVDGSNLTINGILSAFDGSNSHLQSLFKPLKESFTGDAADIGVPLVNQLEQDLVEFKDALNQVRAAIEATGGSAGMVKDTDKAQAARFLAIG